MRFNLVKEGVWDSVDTLHKLALGEVPGGCSYVIRYYDIIKCKILTLYDVNLT